MRIDPTDPLAPKVPFLDQREHFLVPGDRRSRNPAQPSKQLGPPRQRAACQLTNHTGVHQGALPHQKILEKRHAFSKVRYPNGSVYEDHFPGLGRRLRIGLMSGWEPPIAASRRAASRARRASRPACRRAVFSRIPVSFRASSINFSSRSRVVLMHIIMHDSCIRCQCPHPFAFLISSTSAGTIWNRSPTIP
jgi:hypothetical protein